MNKKTKIEQARELAARNEIQLTPEERQFFNEHNGAGDNTIIVIDPTPSDKSMAEILEKKMKGLHVIIITDGRTKTLNHEEKED
jgi:Mg-chelatase subunit ChlD